MVLPAEASWVVHHGSPLHKKSAAHIFLLYSKALMSIKTFAHNLFHTICAEHVAAKFHYHANPPRIRWRWQASRTGKDYTSKTRRVLVSPVIPGTTAQAGDCLKNRLALVSLIESSTWPKLLGFAHLVFHSLCAKTAAWAKRSRCSKVERHILYVWNQGLGHCYVCLRTILSTKCVQKHRVRNACLSYRKLASFFIFENFL
jgi:hypothetical protein